MRPATQKPDSNTPEIRDMLKDLRERGWLLEFIEPPNGFGCDFVIFLYGRSLYVEVKTPEKRNRFTPQEVKLMEICKKTRNEYYVIISPEELLEVIG